MDTTTTRRPTTLRARLIAEGALDADDPFAGDDLLWADEDWAAPDDGSWSTFTHGLLFAVVLSALAWLLAAGSVFFLYRLVA
jgi:hypothetical protein